MQSAFSIKFNLPRHWSTLQGSLALQTNGYDCGICALAAAMGCPHSMDDPSACLRFRRWWVWQILLDLERSEPEMVATSQEDDYIIVDPAPTQLRQHRPTTTSYTAKDSKKRLLLSSHYN